MATASSSWTKRGDRSACKCAPSSMPTWHTKCLEATGPGRQPILRLAVEPTRQDLHDGPERRCNGCPSSTLSGTRPLSDAKRLKRMPDPAPNTRAHLEWLGFIQPNGLLVSAPALVKAGAILNRACETFENSRVQSSAGAHGAMPAIPPDEDEVISLRAPSRGSGSRDVGRTGRRS